MALFAAFGMRQRLATDPIILLLLLANHGFTAGLLLGLAYFATVNGLTYVLSLFFQNAPGPQRVAGGARAQPADGRHHHLLVRRPPADSPARPPAGGHRAAV